MQDRLDFIGQTVRMGSLSLGADLIPEEEAWLTRTIDAALQTNENRLEPLGLKEKIAEQLAAAMQGDNRRLRARGLVNVGKQSLLRSAGLGANNGSTQEGRILKETPAGVKAATTADAQTRYYMDTAAMAFRSAATIDPHVDSQIILLPEHKGEGLIADPDEVRRLVKVAQNKGTLSAYPWLLRISSRVPQLSNVVRWCIPELLSGSRSGISLPSVISTDSTYN